MRYYFYDLAKETFIVVKKPLSMKNVWMAAVELGFAKKMKSFGKTPWRTLAARIYLDIKENPDTDFVQVSKRPAKFYLKDLYDDYQNKEIEKKT